MDSRRKGLEIFIDHHNHESTLCLSACEHLRICVLNAIKDFRWQRLVHLTSQLTMDKCLKRHYARNKFQLVVRFTHSFVLIWHRMTLLVLEDSVSRDQLPPDQLSRDQLATRSTLTRSTCHEINSIFNVGIKINMNT